MEQKMGNFRIGEQTNSEKISYNFSENWNEAQGSTNPRFSHNPSNSVNMTAGPRPVLNYSIETGEEFALEFMWKRVNPRQPNNLRPPVEAIQPVSRTVSTNRSIHRPDTQPTPSGSFSSGPSRGMKVLCSFGGKILPRPSDRKLRYVGGETRIVRIGKEITWDEIRQRTLTIYPEPHSIKYQLPGEDLDVLVSVSCEEDVQNMIEECSVIDGGGSQKLRVFLVSDNESDDSQLVIDNVDGNSDVQYVNHNSNSGGSQQIAPDTDGIEKTEPNHKSEMKSASDCESAPIPLEIHQRKMNEKEKPARFGVGAGTSEHGDILHIDINDRFPRQFLSDLFRTSEAEMVTHDPDHWSFFQNLAKFGDDCGVVDYGYMPFEAGASAADQRQSSGPLKPDIVTLPSDYDISQTNGVESLQSNQQIRPTPVVSDHQDVKRAIQPAGVPLVEKNELNHESESEMNSALEGESTLTPLEIHERKMNEKEKSVCFNVGAGTLEHGDILIDINDRFPRELLFDIFRTAESSVGVVTHTAGLSMNMVKPNIS